MKKPYGILAFVCLALWICVSPVFASVKILCYHEVDGKETDKFSVSSENLENHIRFLKEDGYRFVSLEDYLDYTRGALELPEKSVMLTFDDGYLSFYDKAFPLLKKYKVPAMLAIVTSWDKEAKPADVGSLLSWDKMIEMEKSGLVTIASHSHALHKQRPINPQKTAGAVAENRLYFGGRYETEEEYERRLGNDLRKVQELFQAHLGHPAKAVVWPYGRFSGKSTEIARKHGFEAMFLLDGGDNPPGENARHFAKRGLIYGNPGVKDLKRMLDTNLDVWNHAALRMAQVDLDGLYHKDPKEFEKNVAALKDRLYKNRVKLVALQAFADPDGDGNVESVYFYNHQVPVAADAFNYVANSLSQDGYRVVAWMPGLAIKAMARPDGSNLIAAEPKENLGWYRRVSPFDPEARERLKALYRDLANYTSADGVLFQDDFYMNDFEDASPYGQKAFFDRFHKPLAELNRADRAEMNEWSKLKTAQINDLVNDLAAAFKENRPDGIVMRNIYTDPAINPDAEEWFAQDMSRYLTDYDYTVVMAYPYMDGAEDPEAYLKHIVGAVKQRPGALEKVVFKLQSYDWAGERWLTEEELNRQAEALLGAGAVHIGYYPDTPMPLKAAPRKAVGGR